MSGSKISNHRIDETETDKQDSIPYQLQKVFAQLQTSNQCPTTVLLTKSFQWDYKQSWEQNDIQEFCTIFFDAIETSLESSPQSGLTSMLYQSILNPTIQCLECGYESKTVDKIYDFNLPIKDEFSNFESTSIESSFAHYFHEETLNGSNQYECPVCQKKVDATKGTRIGTLPPVLQIVLNRFTFDFTSANYQRIKLNN